MTPTLTFLVVHVIIERTNQCNLQIKNKNNMKYFQFRIIVLSCFVMSLYEIISVYHFFVLHFLFNNRLSLTCPISNIPQ